MADTVFIHILDELRDDEFKRFKWFLKKDTVDGLPPISESRLSRAEREDTVDLMEQKYGSAGAVETMERVLKKISRNDLVKKLATVSSGAAGAGPAGTRDVPAGTRDVPAWTRDVPAWTRDVPAGTRDVSAEEKLKSVRTQFIESVSEPVLHKLLDKLLERRVVTEGEMEAVAVTPGRKEKARVVIDTVRRKGPAASFALIAALREEDPCLSSRLNFM
ncbi:uncharacterized protein si:ch211-114l13.9 isoform X1 [Seriola aureovittata]|uniref:uncharacterized protein si:ch211-114l13.9 isoform X1 n=1 Tax=Seriola aureovittata TaxID=2871759 RepID=UPI0024BE9345|nr:uncharacterized protein si:ch211-114l13.9 isoform X1 [Seriola aureovittata]XP_056219911.1 uncharacterized protein si:ch211-114l13.9 isoform X1 [Seriola aureovittata]XP_056219912.1 uncharacterized protein si:ch211-114l13.9 isoform X1 [Seriola aureovittata]XP_056219913.1 uncharacterized protein si:ch211-114l13.9 isoform X1 [Seriola aureovittata]XP_056219914.1 uncharacterized protein si:ch211-114l13.9 isoform X1 [Seriola aureovittata]XP_056219915.1 uncharacterized protein si:ch211-114l13.9 iso